MKATIKIKKEVNITTLEVKATPRYWEDTTVNGIEDKDGTLIPCRNGENWCPVIDIETGIITNWEKGKTAKVHYKVCDEGCYFLKEENGIIVASIEDAYVPNILDIYGDSFGDYIILNIDENGKIEDWDNEPEIMDFDFNN